LAIAVGHVIAASQAFAYQRGEQIPATKRIAKNKLFGSGTAPDDPAPGILSPKFPRQTLKSTCITEPDVVSLGSVVLVLPT
jgi:hypothetical protein